MANEQNLKPMKPGETLNPHGRPKGTRNRSTIIREILAQVKEGKDIDGSMQKREIEYWIALKKVHNALSGKDNAINDVMDWVHGKQENKNQITGVDGQPFNIIVNPK